MRKTMILLLAAIPVSLQAQRIFEVTTDSWLFPNHSIETYKERVITGFTDMDPNTGMHTPTFKVTDVNGGGAYVFYTDFALGMDIQLMDFTVREDHETIFLAAFTQNFPYELVVAEIDFNGGWIQSEVHGLYNGFGMVPHQIIYSESHQQVAIVGAHVKDKIDNQSYAGLTKMASVLVLDAYNLWNQQFNIEVDTPQGGNSDNDIFENITEFPDGYFISGSANDPSSGQQLLSVLGVDFGGGYIHSNIWDNSNSRYAGASVMYSPNQNGVYLIANNSVVHEFEIDLLDPWTGLSMTGTMHRYLTSSLPIGSNVDQNGFRLQETNDGLIVIAGYFTCWDQVALPNLITPFQMTLDPALGSGALIAHRLFQSDNNFDPGYYMSMIGNSVYINTPDMMVYNRDFDRTFLVNPNSNMGGFDNHFSHAIEYRECEEELPIYYFDNPWTNVASYDIPPTQIYSYGISENPTERKPREEYLCWSQAKSDKLVPFGATLFPNPASEQLTIALDNEEIRSVAIYDLNGALLQHFDLETAFETTVDVRHLAPGTYLIDVTDANGTVHRGKFMKD